MTKFTILHLYPNEMNLYGDSGNVMCLYKRLNWRGYNCKVVEKGIGDKINTDFDMLFIGGGQDREMKLLQKDVLRKADTLCYAVESEKVVLAICGGYQIFGSYYKTHDGEQIDLLNGVDFYTIGSKKRMIGNFVFDTHFGKVVGFENHSGKTYLGENVSSLGNIITGYGNNGKDGLEGVLYKNFYGTYAHGPVLPKNPNFADEIIKKITGVNELAPLDDSLEIHCQQHLIKRFCQKL